MAKAAKKKQSFTNTDIYLTLRLILDPRIAPRFSFRCADRNTMYVDFFIIDGLFLKKTSYSRLMLADHFHLYVVHSNFKSELIKEIRSVKIDFGNYILSNSKVENSIWAQDIWYDVKEIKFNSISEAANELKKIHSHWASDSLTNHRRAKLIQEKLNFYKHPQLEFMGSLPKQKFGRWLMVDENTILASSNCRSPIPFGKIEFKENKEIPPSRAYLKLWEVLTLHEVLPNKNARCIDLGSCPGGWTWVLSQVAGEVISVDKAPLDPKIAKIRNVKFVKKDAFKLDPEEVGPIDWLFSDIICEPNRLFELVQVWKNSGVKNFVCTIKFKGKTDFEAIERFRSITGSRLIHLYQNKHEITWILQK